MNLSEDIGTVVEENSSSTGDATSSTTIETFQDSNKSSSISNKPIEIEIDTLTPDCLRNKCDNNEIHLRIDQKYDNDTIKTDHYYLIQAVKNDNVDYLLNYYTTNYNVSVNDQLLYGYSGNTIFHHAVFHNSFRCIEYLLTAKFDYSITNKDNNSVLHIACLKGNYDGVYKLLKHGANLECKNLHGDTALHSAVRSGSFNCVKIILQNNGISCILIKNIYGETPLHTSVLPVRFDLEKDENKRKVLKDRMNIEIVRILLEYGSEVHNINKKEETILKTLSKKNNSIAREQIRTLLQKVYYNNYHGDDYLKYLNDYPEIRPFELDTSLEENLKHNYDEYSNKLDEDSINIGNLVQYPKESIRDENLYIPKNVEHFSNNTNNMNEEKKNINTIGLIIIIVIVLFILFCRFN